MRFAALFLIGWATVTTAGAQTGPARVAFLPMPNTLPTLLFAPDSLAGTLLRPLAQPADGSPLPEVKPEPASLAGDPPKQEKTSALALAQVEEPAPAPQPEAEAVPEPPAAAEPETQATAPAEPPPPPAAEKPHAGKVTVIVENVQSSDGVVNVALCAKGLSREGCTYFKEVKASPGFVETEFEEVPPGTYAVVAYHDVNGNDQFDQFMKIPREPYALSSKAADELVPSFEDAALPIKAGDNAVILRLKTLGG
jgi:uncharacterized protein (DUF2141 family)